MLKAQAFRDGLWSTIASAASNRSFLRLMIPPFSGCGYGVPWCMFSVISRAYYGASATELREASSAAILGEVVAHHTFAIDENQRNAWQAERRA